MPRIGQQDSPDEDWKRLVVRNDELYDPIFQDNTGFTRRQGDGFISNYEAAESVTSEQPYPPSEPVSIPDGTPSLVYVVSAPPSIDDDVPPFDPVYCTSPSFDTETSSFGGRYFGSFNACNTSFTPPEPSIESPILDTRYERIADSFASPGFTHTAAESAWNPYVVASSCSYSGLDVSASQVFTNGEAWVEQPQVIEPMEECDDYRTSVAPIPIPQPYTPSFNDMAMQFPRSAAPQHMHSVATTIPRPRHGPAAYNAGVSSSHWVQRRPALSASPVSQRRARSAALPRSSSQIESRKKIGTSSPTSLEWVSYQMDTQTNRLTPLSIEGVQSRNARGRKKCLTAEQRKHAALMRIVRSCSNCQRRKAKCDPGTPCRPCLDYYKGSNLVKSPCRDRLLTDLSSVFLSDRLGWHPTVRPPELFIARNSYSVDTGITYTIPLNFGFGPALSVPVHALRIENNPSLIHQHVIYSWPPELSAGSIHIDAVLPAVLTPDAVSNLPQSLDVHLSLLVTHHFRAFPLYCSPLQILREVYIFFRSLPPHKPHSRILHQALKLLVLVHIGGDITLPVPSENADLVQLMRITMNHEDEEEDDEEPTPCFIRSQFGSIMPALASSYMKDVLSSLEALLLGRLPEDWPVVLAILLTVLMTVESIHYHAAKMPYHSSYGPPHCSDPDEDRGADDDGVKTLLAFYSACFAGYHARLRPDWEGEAQRAYLAEDVFVESVRDVVRRANDVGYLARKAEEKRRGNDMEFFFDRLVARLLLLEV